MSKNVMSSRVIYTAAFLLFAVVVGIYLRSRGYEMFTGPASVKFYYMTGCPHCVDFEPQWEMFVADAKKAGITTDKIESKDKRAQTAGITGFPTIMVKKAAADKEVVYSGDRTSAALMKFVKA